MCGMWAMLLPVRVFLLCLFHRPEWLIRGGRGTSAKQRRFATVNPILSGAPWIIQLSAGPWLCRWEGIRLCVWLLHGIQTFISETKDFSLSLSLSLSLLLVLSISPSPSVVLRLYIGVCGIRKSGPVSLSSATFLQPLVDPDSHFLPVSKSWF